MKAELQKFLKLFEDLEEAGASLTLTFLTRESKTTAKQHLETLSSSPPPTLTALSSLPPSPGKQRRHCGARARAVRNQRAAAHQASLAEAATSALVSPSPRPPCLHPSPPPASGRRIVTTLARVDVPTFSTLNVDGASSPTPPPLPPPLLRPPFCFSNCPEDHHCPNCRRCAFLCVEHNGDPCDPDNKEEDCRDICAVCELQEGVRYLNPRKPM